ncbi:toluene tolerance protein [Pseudomonas tohonis]|uniref:Toluene tolerance protein n=1 Tax=Pseudomonas tohonis TaxID=2725477 RepID=A0A6J4EC51_9PSED|nr:toluene tolerance protein [Pseudomonas tohonis]BCG27357.1 toluene tolerance protein [Pseudomonas tohonis]GJN52862.1 toluene tolerance protein [Pseudomonas tohonis]
MQALNHETYLELSSGAEVLERDGHGEKVLHLVDGSIFKLFRRKRFLSSTAFYPYAQRFSDNVEQLKNKGIPCPEMIGVYRIKGIDRDVVHYKPLPGETLRHVKNRLDNDDDLRRRLGIFIAELHAKGIYFRSLHLGNIVLTPDEKLGLIDIADLKSLNKALSQSMRLRNFHHLLRYHEDRKWLIPEQNTVFRNAYLSAAELGNCATFRDRLSSI